MKPALLIFVFGGLGSLCRYLLGLLNPAFTGFAWGTFTANVAACFVAGLGAGYLAFRPGVSPDFRLALITGFCGGFSTFSSFSLEAVNMAHFQRGGLALAYVGASLVVCLGACYAGMLLGRKI